MRSGTGAAATQKLGRRDLAGKTGTTSDAVDGWFAGYVGNIVAVSWMGYDEPKSLGGREFGATVAPTNLIDAMRHARPANLNSCERFQKTSSTLMVSGCMSSTKWRRCRNR